MAILNTTRTYGLRPTVVFVDTAAIAENVASLVAAVSPSALCAVVKADGYGHGAVAAARSALEGGATSLAVALVEEGLSLRDAGIEASILVLSEQHGAAARALVECRLDATVASVHGVESLFRALCDVGTVEVIDAHLKIDTGMHRMGVLPGDLDDVAGALRKFSDRVRWAGTWTHFAVADEPQNSATAEQQRRFEAAIARLRVLGHDVGIVHAANSAGAIAHPSARYDMVRCGIAIYGQSPDAAFDMSTYGLALRPAISLHSEVSAVRIVPAGDSVSYGHRYTVSEPTIVATVPVGYADGVARRLFDVGGEVLIGGKRRRIAGRITMDQLMVDCGPAVDSSSVVAAEAAPAGVLGECGAPAVPAVRVGDPVVLLGQQGTEEVTVWEWAEKLGTIAYEIVCALALRATRMDRIER